MITVARRNLKIFFRDKASVFFSLLAVFIVIGLYVLFLGDSLENDFTSNPAFAGVEGIKLMITSWVMAGILAVTSVTTTMGAFGIMVEDRTKKTLKDFQASPIKRSQLVGGYILSSFTVGAIMSMVTFILAEVYIVIIGGTLLAPLAILKMLGVLLLSILAGTSLMFFIVSFFKTQNSFATASNIIGVLIGFITGIYLPIGSLPEVAQTVIKIFPISHAALLFRQIFLAGPMATSFAGAPVAAVDEFEKMMGITFHFGDNAVTTLTSVLILIGTAVLFYLLSIWNLSRKAK